MAATLARLGVLLATSLVAGGCAYTVGGPHMQKATQCPLHGVPFEVFRVPTVYGLVRDSEAYRDARKDSFPYAAEPSRQGCVVGLFSWMNRHDHVRACPVCTAAWKEYEATHDKNRGETSNSRVNPPVDLPSIM